MKKYICVAKCPELDHDNSKHCVTNNPNNPFPLYDYDCPCGNCPIWEEYIVQPRKEDKEMKKYNTLVRQAISDKYVECSKTKSMVSKERQLIISRLELEKETLPYNEYIRLQKKAETMAKEIEELSIQLNVWDMAREICLNVADDNLSGKENE